MFKHLNAEAIKTKSELEEEKAQRWTTFLQKPDRPIPKSKAELENERRKEIEQRIRLDMQFKKELAAKEAAEQPADDQQTTNNVDADAAADGPCCDGIHCGTPPCEECDARAASGEKPASTEDNADAAEAKADADADDATIEVANSDDREATPEVLEPPLPPKTAEELLVEKKLSDIQQQLLALSALPVTIQATLDAVSRQLTDLLPTLSKTQPISTGVAADEPNAQANEGRQ